MAQGPKKPTKIDRRGSDYRYYSQHVMYVDVPNVGRAQVISDTFLSMDTRFVVLDTNDNPVLSYIGTLYFSLFLPKVSGRRLKLWHYERNGGVVPLGCTISACVSET